MRQKILNITLLLLVVIVIGIILGFSERELNNQVCKEINIEIDHSNGNYFIEEADIYLMVYHEMDTVVGKLLRDIDSESLEYKLRNHPAINSTEVYKTLDGSLNISIQQRTPIVRIINNGGEGFYIDSSGYLMPTSSNYTSRVMVVTGAFNDSFYRLSKWNTKNIPDSLVNEVLVDNIYELAYFISKDEFWKAQIEQLHVNKDSEFELIPRIGNHRIVLGETVDIARKFNKLKLFYEKGLSKTGWNEYSKIDLRFSKQIVCTKRI